MARDRTIHNNVVSDVTSPMRVRRSEVLGVERRRQWPDAERIAIVAEALEPGVVVSQVARRHDLNPSQLFGWLKRYRAEALALRSAAVMTDMPTFAPVMIEAVATPSSAMATTVAASEPPSIEISIGSAMVRIRGAAEAKTLAAVLKALRALA